jgi:hypothetical protein
MGCIESKYLTNTEVLVSNYVSDAYNSITNRLYNNNTIVTGNIDIDLFNVNPDRVVTSKRNDIPRVDKFKILWQKQSISQQAIEKIHKRKSANEIKIDHRKFIKNILIQTIS